MEDSREQRFFRTLMLQNCVLCCLFSFSALHSVLSPPRAPARLLPLPYSLSRLGLSSSLHSCGSIMSCLLRSFACIHTHLHALFSLLPLYRSVPLSPSVLSMCSCWHHIHIPTAWRRPDRSFASTIVNWPMSAVLSWHFPLCGHSPHSYRCVPCSYIHHDLHPYGSITAVPIRYCKLTIIFFIFFAGACDLHVARCDLSYRLLIGATLTASLLCSLTVVKSSSFIVSVSLISCFACLLWPDTTRCLTCVPSFQCLAQQHVIDAMALLILPFMLFPTVPVIPHSLSMCALTSSVHHSLHVLSSFQLTIFPFLCPILYCFASSSISFPTELEW